MSQRFFLTLVVFGFLVNGKIFAQQKNVEKFSSLSKYSFVFPEKINSSFSAMPSLFSSNDGPKSLQVINPFLSLRAINLKCDPDFIGAGYYTKQLGFFCRKELQVEHAISLPLRFRLGSLEYTDYLEKKPNSYFRR